MIGKNVGFTRHGITVSGVCQHVIRRPLNNIILIVIDGIEYQFPEPTKIDSVDGKLSFLYGTKSTDIQEGADMFEFCGEELNIEWGEDIRKSIGREKACFIIEFNVT